MARKQRYTALTSLPTRAGSRVARGWLSLTATYTSLLRNVGLEITTVTKGPEEPKRLFEVSWRAALARCGVHVLPAAVSIILITINLLGYFIGNELQGPSNTNGIKMGILQICAKAQELLIVASLSTVIFHILRSEMVFGAGLPLGLMGAGFNFTSLSFFWSSEFWGSITYKHPSPFRKACIFVVLVIAGIIAVLAGPTSAVLMIPRELDWATGGGIFWLNGTREQMWPSKLNPSSQNCSGNIWVSDPRCLSNGYFPIVETFRTRKGGVKDGVVSFELQDRDIRKTVHARVRVPDLTVIETWVYTVHTPTAIMQAATYALWASALGYLRQNARLTTHPNPDSLGYAASRVATVKTELPAVRTVCNDEVFSVAPTDAFIGANFPALPEYSMRWFSDPATPGTDTQYFQVVDVTEAARNKMNQGSNGTILLTPTQLEPSGNQSSSFGVFLLSPGGVNDTWNLQACTIDPRWASGKTIIDENVRTAKYDFAADQGRSLMDSELKTIEFGWGGFAPPNDGTWRRIEISNEWFDSLGAETPLDAQSQGNTSSTETTIESILNVVAPNGLGEEGATLMLEFALAVVVVDGISRSSSHRTSNYSAMLEPVVSSQWSGQLAKSFMRLGGPKEAFHPANADNLARLTMQVTLHGFVMAAVGWFDYLCICVLLCHALIAIAHTAWVLWWRRTSDAWESITELMALSLNSERPGRTGEDGFDNTSAGVRTWVPIRQLGWVEASAQKAVATATDRPEQLQLRFGRGRHVTGSDRDPSFQVQADAAYGKS
ncbi:hypothetical protein AK830_g4230 [Neonectria ditissima]|uniref:Uncharacterized protein n=1 Tax=Neonectria ditissima TaxID=78410 RepID=A0A0P7AWI8_9HYPO|nr:hypothetical protein AK830_g4230 [Neonectria ditissima]